MVAQTPADHPTCPACGAEWPDVWTAHICKGVEVDCHLCGQITDICTRDGLDAVMIKGEWYSPSAAARKLVEDSGAWLAVTKIRWINGGCTWASARRTWDHDQNKASSYMVGYGPTSGSVALRLDCANL